jgi:hypothetical protein
MSRKRIKKGFSYLIIVVSVVFIALGIFLILNYFNHRETKNLVYSYNVTKNVDSKVNIFDNGFYDASILQDKEGYPSNGINTIDFGFTYALSAPIAADINYSYHTNVDLNADFNIDNKIVEVWEKRLQSGEQHTETTNGSQITIQDTVSIDYASYYNLVRTYMVNYNLSIDAYLDVVFTIDYQVTVPETKEVTNKTDSIVVKVPLNETVTIIKPEITQTPTQEFFKNVHNTNAIELFFGTILIMIGVSGILAIIIINNKTAKDKYKSNMSRILRDYGDLIVTVTNKPNLYTFNLMNVGTIEDLIDLVETNNLSIIRYENKAYHESYLIALKDSYAYVYVVNDHEIK